jgi:hypothetical protein
MLAHHIQNYYIYISKQTQTYTDDRYFMPKEQKGCCRASKGCKDQLLISNAISEECKSSKKNVCTAWIDSQKTFESASQLDNQNLRVNWD